MRVVALCASVAFAAAQQCSVPDPSKVDCGHVGTQKSDCEASGCCWQPVQSEANVPWCYHPATTTCTANWTATGVGFTDSFTQTMYGRFVKNFNINGTGMVVAAPDRTPNADVGTLYYYYHWMRDAALSIWTLMKLNDFSYDKVKDIVRPYERWVARAQSESDPNGIDVRIEPKFDIPSGTVYNQGWCRPQTDGPGLRANTMVAWARVLVSAGQTDYAKNTVWPLVQRDLAWVVSNWQSNGCDLWEEVQSTDFFWNRMGFIYALNEAADLADQLGLGGAAQYRSTAQAVKAAVQSHFNGQFLYESTNRPQDTAVIHAVTTFGKYVFPPLSREVALTVGQLNEVFCQEYELNAKDTAAGIPGLLYGRYPGDTYRGGNPWQLLSAVYAECFYAVSQAVAELEASRGGSFVLDDSHAEWLKVLKLPSGSSSSALRAAAKSAGDAVMTRIWAHVRGDGGLVTEQIDRTSGRQISAKDLTWSYANILHSLYVRKQL